MTTQNSSNTTLNGQSGTGNFVGSTSPTIDMLYLTPAAAGGIYESTFGSQLLNFSGVSGATNIIQINNALTGSAPIIRSVSSNANVPLQLMGRGNQGVIVQGTGTNDDAAAGNVGELISSQILFASATSISNNSTTNLTSISLTAGNWMVYGNVSFTGSGGATLTTSLAWLSTSSATLPDVSLRSGLTGATLAVDANYVVCAPLNLKLPSTSTVFVSGFVTFAAGSCTQSGQIFAVRVR